PGGHDRDALADAAGRSGSQRNLAGLRGKRMVRHWRSEAHAGRDHRKTEQGSQRQRCRSETPSATCRSGRHGAWRVPRRFRQADLRRGQEVEQGDAGGQYQAGMNSRRAAALRNFDPAYVGSGSWPCENSGTRRARRNISKKLRISVSNHAARMRPDAVLENCIFYISPMYEFSHSQGQSRPFGDVCSMSGLPPKADLPPDLGTTSAASSWRTPPSRPRASARSRASACGLWGGGGGGLVLPLKVVQTSIGALDHPDGGET